MVEEVLDEELKLDAVVVLVEVEVEDDELDAVPEAVADVVPVAEEEIVGTLDVVDVALAVADDVGIGIHVHCEVSTIYPN